MPVVIGQGNNFGFGFRHSSENRPYVKLLMRLAWYRSYCFLTWLFMKTLKFCDLSNYCVH